MSLNRPELFTVISDDIHLMCMCIVVPKGGGV